VARWLEPTTPRGLSNPSKVASLKAQPGKKARLTQLAKQLPALKKKVAAAKAALKKARVTRAKVSLCSFETIFFFLKINVWDRKREARIMSNAR
jgi:hypothetical protein